MFMVENVYGEKPDISNLVPFYSPEICKISKAEKDHSLQANGQECRMLGCDDAGKNVYLVYNCESHKVERRENVRFNESIDFNREGNDKLNTNPRFKFINLDEETIQYHGGFFEEIGEFSNNDAAMIVEIVENAEKENKKALDMKVLKLPECPKNVAEAISGLNSSIWEEAIYKELLQIIEKGTFQEVDLPKETRVAKMKMVLQVSFDNGFKIKYKARFVVCGYSQIMEWIIKKLILQQYSGILYVLFYTLPYVGLYS
jgi:hypothetical protein